MQHNLFSPFGFNPLQYPHYTKWDKKPGLVHLVTHPDKKVQEGDEVFVGIPYSNENGDPQFQYLYVPAVVIEVQETRKAKGEHSVDFEPVYQRISIL